MQLTIFDAILARMAPSSSGRTFPASSAPKTTPSGAFLQAWLDLIDPSFRADDGRTRVWLLDPRAQSLGGVSMPNISAWPNGASVCSLSQVLEAGPIPARYFLSPKACAGILRRAAKRKRKLPEPLRLSLEAVTSLVR